MKIDFEVNTKDYTEYCINCHRPNMLRQQRDNDALSYVCTNCDTTNPRALIMDPQLMWEIAPDNEYCHSSVGAFIFNQKNDFLMFKLNKFPFGATIPAGHVDVGESAKKAVEREIKEEVNIPVVGLVRLMQTTIDGDGCRRGADRHHWTVFCARVTSDVAPVVDKSEGAHPVWVSLRQAQQRTNCFAVDYILDKHIAKIEHYLSRGRLGLHE